MIGRGRLESLELAFYFFFSLHFWSGCIWRVLSFISALVALRGGSLESSFSPPYKKKSPGDEARSQSRISRHFDMIPYD